MKYVALLRGINVGGNNPVKMSILKKVFEENQFKNVTTYINSGNVIFESGERDTGKLTEKLESILSQSFKYKARVILKSQAQIKQVIKAAPQEWDTRNDIRCYIGFLARSASKEEIKNITVREDVDQLKIGNEVLYMTSLLNQLAKSAFNKIAITEIYQEMTIRNYNTIKKILFLMEQE